jgi:hypothetical protein
VKLEGERAVLVAAANGGVRVFNEMGDLLANVRPGMALSVLPAPAAQAEASILTGCVRKVDGRYLLTDTTANLTVELRGGNLDPHVGKMVRAEGTVFRTATPAPGATQVIRVGKIEGVEGECAPEVATAKPPAPSTTTTRPPTPPSSGGSKVSGATIGLIAAGGAAAAVGVILATRSSDTSR